MISAAQTLLKIIFQCSIHVQLNPSIMFCWKWYKNHLFRYKSQTGYMEFDHISAENVASMTWALWQSLVMPVRSVWCSDLVMAARFQRCSLLFPMIMVLSKGNKLHFCCSMFGLLATSSTHINIWYPVGKVWNSDAHFVPPLKVLFWDL